MRRGQCTAARGATRPLLETVLAATGQSQGGGLPPLLSPPFRLRQDPAPALFLGTFRVVDKANNLGFDH